MDSQVRAEFLEHYPTLLDKIQEKEPRSYSAYTTEHPHTCSNCDDFVIDGGKFGGPGARWSNYPFKFILPRNLQRAVQASSAGCTLYECFLKILVAEFESECFRKYYGKHRTLDELMDVRFTLEFEIAAHTCVIPRLEYNWEDGSKLNTEDGNETWVWSSSDGGQWKRQIVERLAVSTQKGIRGPLICSNSADLGSTTGNAAAKYIRTRPAESRVVSQMSIEFAKKCLKSCLDTHRDCRRAQPTLTWAIDVSIDGSNQEGKLKNNKTYIREVTEEELDRIGETTLLSSGSCTFSPETVRMEDLPERLLRITSTDPLQAKLVDVLSLETAQQTSLCAKGFVALSYCWGGDQQHKLTSATRSLLEAGTSVGIFSQTIQDAIWFAAQMGHHYIWIDALCILQDDDDDKAREIARMGLYYGANSFTICAASSPSSRDGFLQKRYGHGYKTGPIRLRYQTEGIVGHILICDLLDNLLSTQPTSEPLSARAWTLQESMLSRRSLIFASKQLFWNCCSSNAACGGGNDGLIGRTMGFPRSFVPGIFPINVMWQMPAGIQWIHLVRDYTSRNITVSGDKLLAIYALAEHLHSSFTKWQGRHVYLAGLFLSLDDHEHAAGSLLWYTDFRASRVAQEYRAPSWSWACLDGTFESLSTSEATSSSYAVTSEVVSYDVALKSSLAPYGAVNSAQIIIRAPLHLVSLVDNVRNPLSIVFLHSEEDRQGLYKNKLKENRVVALIPDAQTHHAALESSLSLQSSLFLLEIYKRGDSDRGPPSSVGIIISPVDKEQKVFRRIGLYLILEREVGVSHYPRFDFGDSSTWTDETTKVTLI